MSGLLRQGDEIRIDGHRGRTAATESRAVIAEALGQVVPMYAYPANLSNGHRGEDEWRACSTGVARHPLTFVVANVANGVSDGNRFPKQTHSPGPGALLVEESPTHALGGAELSDPNYRRAIARCSESGAVLLGYINLGWGETELGRPGSTDLATVLGQVRLWFELYPGIKGVFLDQVATTGTRTERRYQRKIAENVPGTVVINSGQLPRTDWLFDSGADLVVYENYVAELECLRLPGWISRYAPWHLGAILHDVGSPAEVIETCSQARAKGFGFVYVTDGRQDSGNPYDGLPSPPIWAALTAARRADCHRNISSISQFR
ncbi:MAG TPA: spherulation-specific family 4 protein [Acidimicrobiales bacterium]|nr:spherulation-specific family 4 protein [Acidimicrobiales bacterium]